MELKVCEAGFCVAATPECTYVVLAWHVVSITSIFLAIWRLCMHTRPATPREG